MVDRGNRRMSESNIDECNTVALVTYRVGALFSFCFDFFQRTRAAVDVDLDIGGKVTAAGFPDPRGGHGSGAPAARTFSCLVDVRAMTDAEVA